MNSVLLEITVLIFLGTAFPSTNSAGKLFSYLNLQGKRWCRIFANPFGLALEPMGVNGCQPSQNSQPNWLVDD